jgi:hypothetical protein
MPLKWTSSEEAVVRSRRAHDPPLPLSVAAAPLRFTPRRRQSQSCAACVNGVKSREADEAPVCSRRAFEHFHAVSFPVKVEGPEETERSRKPSKSLKQKRADKQSKREDKRSRLRSLTDVPRSMLSDWRTKAVAQASAIRFTFPRRRHDLDSVRHNNTSRMHPADQIRVDRAPSTTPPGDLFVIRRACGQVTSERRRGRRVAPCR